MNDIFSNLVNRNAVQPSSEVVQPRFPSMFEPFGDLEGPTESILDQNTSFSAQAASRMEAELPSSSPTDHDSHSPSVTSFHEISTTKKFTDQSLAYHSSHLRDSESVEKKPIQQFAHPQLTSISYEPVHPSIADISLEDTNDDLRRSATIMSNTERNPARASVNDPHREKVTSEERTIHPRVESVTAHKVDSLVGSSRTVPGRMDKSMNVLQPREESNHAEPPVVQIHIGRIEVRAITPSPSQPASKPAPAQPRMTLEDYLRQREGRR